MTDFPTSKDDRVDNVDDAVADDINSLQDKVGIDNSAVTTTHDYKLSGATGSDKAVSLTGEETLTNKIIGGSQLVDSSVTTAKITNPYMFSAYPSSVTSLVDAIPTKITFGNEDYDYNNNFASSTYTAPVDGVYQFNATFNLGIVVSGVVAFCAIYVNDALVKRGAKVPIISGCGATISTDILLAANDTVDVYGYQSSAGDEGTVVNADRTYFNGHLVAQV